MELKLNGTTEDCISYILTKKPNSAWLKRAKDYAWNARMHMTGIGKEQAIERLDYYEDPRLLALRQKYSPDNRDLYGRLHRPIDKIWNAKGGSINFYLPEAQKAKMMKLVSNVHGGYNLKDWIKTYWFPAMLYDPMGLILMEVGENETYPEFYSIREIFEMPEPEGRNIEWVIFKLDISEEEEHGTGIAGAINELSQVGTGRYRVIDDKWDRTVKFDGTVVTELDRYPNYYGFVPAVTAGDIWDENTDMFVSPDHNTLPMADQYMRQRSTLTMFEIHHGFPMTWMYGMPCNTCDGTGYREGSPCPTCNGQRVSVKRDVSKLSIIPFPTDKDTPIIDKPGGVVDTAVDSWVEMKETVRQIYKEMHYCTWGTQEVEDSSHSTATGRFIDVQPVNDRLHYFSSAAEWVYMWVVDMEGRFNFGVEKCCGANFGRRYLIETPDELNTKLQDAISKGMNYSYLRDLYMRWIDSEYSGDEMSRRRLIMEFKIDPAPFLTTQQSQSAFADPEQYQKKLYYGQWLETLPDNWYLTGSLDTWRANFEAYVAKIPAAQPKQKATA